jgi:hypothetical protein
MPKVAGATPAMKRNKPEMAKPVKNPGKKNPGKKY